MLGGSCALVSPGALGMSSRGSPGAWTPLWSVILRSVAGRPSSSSRVSGARLGGGDGEALWGGGAGGGSGLRCWGLCQAGRAVPLPCAGDKVFSFDLASRMTKQHMWPWLGPCDAALRWLERYYCLQGTQFQRFDPVIGKVPTGYPRDLRDYFIPCPGRGEDAFWDRPRVPRPGNPCPGHRPVVPC